VVRQAEVVIHLAALVQPDSQQRELMRVVNVEGTRNLFGAATRAGCRLFVHMSSAGVYGHPRRAEPFREDDPLEPITPYQRTKLEAENVLTQSERRDTVVNILRPAGIYGPGSRLEIPEYRRVAGRRVHFELKGGVIVQPTYVDDVVEAMLALVDTPAEDGSVFNVGGERALRLDDLRAVIAEIFDVPLRRIVVPPSLARPLAAAAAPLLAMRRRPSPLLARMARGESFSAAVDDTRFRTKYPDVRVTELQRGVRQHLDWARASGLL
jgi:nucleoside-diphosphate-sugar epimerase